MQKIKITYHIRIETEGEIEQKEMNLEGYFLSGEQEWMVRYVEEDGSQTNWIFRQDQVTLLRKGEEPYQQTFSLEKSEPFWLHTTAGKMAFETVTQHYHLQVDKSGIEVELQYTLYTANTPLSHYQLTLLGKVC